MCIILGQPWEVVTAMPECRLEAIVREADRMEADRLYRDTLVACAPHSREGNKVVTEVIERLRKGKWRG